MASDSLTRAREFLEIAYQFHLGELPTEQQHPLTTNLSELAKNDLAEAYEVLHEVDSQALQLFSQKLDKIEELSVQINNTLKAGNRIYLCGCGATGRLSLVCENLWRLQSEHSSELKERVIAFMAGGDAALIRSIENFEDHPEFGSRQLKDLKFADGDLFIGITEGGETPFVIGALFAALEISKNTPYFFYCNPDDVLCRVAERSASVIYDARIKKINLSVGPMAITGSTRMQASTVLMAGVGAALLYNDAPDKIRPVFDQLLTFWNKLDSGFFIPFTVFESDCYLKNEHLLYEVKDDFAISILTDTTERSPTFSMIPFENLNVPNDPLSLCYLYMPNTKNSIEAWNTLLLRKPRTLEWKETEAVASLNRLLGFDFSANHKVHGHIFSIHKSNQQIRFNLDTLEDFIDIPNLPMLSQHLILKMLLNAHSTLTMGRLGRFEGNTMTFVRPTNRKLIDRTIRYALLLQKRNGKISTYEETAHACFKLLETLPHDRSVVNAIVNG